VHLQNVLFVYVLYIKFHKSSMCICFNCMKFKKFMWHAQLDVLDMLQYVEQRMKVFFGVAWPNMGGRGCYNMVSKI
jgi:hypothetical protein